ncbi:hypothetical protein B0H12DRAFT_1067170 [Mycena haematopus]|nr:hypothetical protein B0H12DRAFT_1067170 [Mycena haematopus]
MLLAPVNEPIREAWGKLQATHAKRSWFRAGQTALSVQQDISTFVEAQEAWVKSDIGDSRAYVEATKWFVGAYATLFASWSVVSMRVVPIAGVGPRQFAIIAEEDLQPQTVIHELIGLLSSDPADGASHSNLSVMQDLDGVPRVLFGPIRLVNHCCIPNARFDFAQHGNGHTVTVRTNKIILKGEEITVSYGRDFWTEDTPCLIFEEVHLCIMVHSMNVDTRIQEYDDQGGQRSRGIEGKDLLNLKPNTSASVPSADDVHALLHILLARIPTTLDGLRVSECGPAAWAHSRRRGERYLKSVQEMIKTTYTAVPENLEI